MPAIEINIRFRLQLHKIGFENWPFQLDWCRFCCFLTCRPLSYIKMLYVSIAACLLHKKQLTKRIYMQFNDRATKRPFSSAAAATAIENKSTQTQNSSKPSEAAFAASLTAGIDRLPSFSQRNPCRLRDSAHQLTELKCKAAARSFHSSWELPQKSAHSLIT